MEQLYLEFDERELENNSKLLKFSIEKIGI